MIRYNKLVRDKIPDILDAKHIPYEKQIADDTEYKQALIEKLQEEVAEFTTDPCVEELADVLEVVIALQALEPYSKLEAVRKEKALTRGAFTEKIILQGEQ